MIRAHVLARLVLCLAPFASAGAAPQVAATDADVAARARGEVVTWEEFDRLLVDRHSMSDLGRASLDHLLKAQLLDKLAQESRLKVPAKDVQARWDEIAREVVASAEAPDLETYLARNRVAPDTFREFLRLAVVQETLARRALGIREGRPVPADQQEMWLSQIIEQRGTDMPPPPWPDGIAARCGDLAVTVSDFLEHLRDQVPPETVREDCYQLLLAKRLRSRLPEISEEAVAAAIDAELERRRAEIASDPTYKGLSFEQILAAQGLRLDSLRRDPAVVVSALAHLWVDRTHGDEGLRAAYEADRATFDGHFGEAIRTRLLFLRAAVMTNDLNPRSFEDAERELAALAKTIRTEAAFEAAVARHSEDPSSRERGGAIGWITAEDPRLPPEVPHAVHRAAEEGLGRVAGPIRMSSGCVLLWLAERRAAPGWDEMRAHVHNELRRRLFDEVLPEPSVVTWLDEEP